MLNYRIDCEELDGRWSSLEFRSRDDPGAISYALGIRTTARCELYQAGRWVASFDGRIFENVESFRTKENQRHNLGEHETEAAYFRRHAQEEREQARVSGLAVEKLGHLGKAELLESLERAILAQERRRAFFEVNASQAGARKAISKAGKASPKTRMQQS